MKTKKWLIPYSLYKTLAVLAAAVTLFAAAPARASTSWVHGGNWADIQGQIQLVHYWAGISNSTTLAQATNVADTIASDYTSVGINFVRVAINPATVTSNWPVTQAAINELVAHGLSVDIGCWYTDWNGTGSGRGTITNMNLWTNMWKTVDGVYKNNNSVYFEPINEPFGYSLAGLESVYNTYLAFIQKSQSHILLDGTNYAANVEQIGAAYPNCLLSLHIYPGWGGCTTEASYESYLANTVVGSYHDRTIITEMGAITTNTARDFSQPDAADDQINCVRGVCIQCEAWGMGLTYFAANIPRAGNGTTNNNLLFDAVGGHLVNASMMKELHFGWGMTNTHTRFDFNGDGQDDCVFFHTNDATWNIVYTSPTNTFETNSFQFGNPGDIPLVGGDFDNDGCADAVVFRPSTSTWYIRSSATKSLLTSFGFGSPGDIPLIAGDFDGDGIPDTAYWRPSVGVFHVRYSSTGNTHVFTNGITGDIPLFGGDFDGDGIPDPVVYRPATTNWYIYSTKTGLIVDMPFGTNNIVPLLGGDFDNDGTEDLTYYHPSDSKWHIQYSGDGSEHIPTDGFATDIPFISYASPDHAACETLYRATNGTFYVRSSASGTVTAIPSIGTTNDIPVF